MTDEQPIVATPAMTTPYAAARLAMRSMTDTGPEDAIRRMRAALDAVLDLCDTTGGLSRGSRMVPSEDICNAVANALSTSLAPFTENEQELGVADAAQWLLNTYGQQLKPEHVRHIATGLAQRLWQPFSRRVLLDYANEIEQVATHNNDMFLAEMAVSLRQSVEDAGQHTTEK